MNEYAPLLDRRGVVPALLVRVRADPHRAVLTRCGGAARTRGSSRDFARLPRRLARPRRRVRRVLLVWLRPASAAGFSTTPTSSTIIAPTSPAKSASPTWSARCCSTKTRRSRRSRTLSSTSNSSRANTASRATGSYAIENRTGAPLSGNAPDVAATDLELESVEIDGATLADDFADARAELPVPDLALRHADAAGRAAAKSASPRATRRQGFTQQQRAHPGEQQRHVHQRPQLVARCWALIAAACCKIARAGAATACRRICAWRGWKTIARVSSIICATTPIG